MVYMDLCGEIELIKRDLDFLENRLIKNEGTQFQSNISDTAKVFRMLKKARREVSNALHQV